MCKFPPTKRANLHIGCGSLIGVFLLCALCSAIANAGNSTQQSATASVSSPVTTQAPPTPTPTATPTPSPTPTETPTPTQAPAQQQPVQQSAPPPAQLFVTITSAYATDYSSGSVSVNTLPGAALTIEVTYCTGHDATSGSLQGTEYADSSGDYTWTWEPETKCRGTATAYVSASLNGQSANDSKSFTVS